jgi:hypothetical protein
MPSLLTFNLQLLTVPLCLRAFVSLCYASLSSVPLSLYPSVLNSFLLFASLLLRAFALNHFFVPSCLVTPFISYLRVLGVFSVVQFCILGGCLPLTRHANDKIGRRRIAPVFPPILPNPAPCSLAPAVEISTCSANIPYSRRSLRRQFGKMLES